MSTVASTTNVNLTENESRYSPVYNAFYSPTAASAVKALRDVGLGDVVYLPGQERFETRIESYWSRTSQLRPWAVVQPQDTREVSMALKALVNTPGCQIAIRSGGHMAAPGASSIEDGVTIDLGLLHSTKYNAETNLASLEPGARWGDVYAELEKCESPILCPNPISLNRMG